MVCSFLRSQCAFLLCLKPLYSPLYTLGLTTLDSVLLPSSAAPKTCYSYCLCHTAAHCQLCRTTTNCVALLQWPPLLPMPSVPTTSSSVIVKSHLAVLMRSPSSSSSSMPLPIESTQRRLFDNLNSLTVASRLARASLNHSGSTALKVFESPGVKMLLSRIPVTISFGSSLL